MSDCFFAKQLADTFNDIEGSNVFIGRIIITNEFTGGEDSSNNSRSSWLNQK